MGDRCETCGEDYTCRRCKCMRTDVTPPNGAPQTGQIVALIENEMHESVVDSVLWNEYGRTVADDIIHGLATSIAEALGLTPPEPKEGGA